MSAPSAPSSEAARYWSEVAGPGWVTVQPLLDRQLAPFDEALLARARPAPGERVIDVGCGCGASTLSLAARVAPGGAVTGVDLSTPMLARARSRVARAAAAVELRQADAGRDDLGEACFDLAYSRFGVMFFPDPVAGFCNLGRALRGGGRLAFVCWQALERNAWMAAPLAAVAPLLTLPPRPAPDAPGPFSLADPERIRFVLRAAGFAEPRCEAFETALAPGGGGRAEALEMLLTVGPVAAALRESGADERVRTGVVAALGEVLERHTSSEGVRMAAAAWLVTARKTGGWIPGEDSNLHS